jgi:PBP1b-binding outer membrane lipoprotein LpoB
MRKLWIGAVFGLLFLGSCAQNKEKREEYKDAHDKDS